MSDGNSIDATPRDLWWFRKNVPCLDACPVKTDAGRYVQLIAEGRLAEAYRVARSPNPIASICGRACGAPCEDACRRGKIDAPVTIRALKRFLTDQFGPEALSSKGVREMIAGPSGGGSTTPGHIDLPGARPDADGSKRKVAVVGAGPAGLACANDLALMGYSVTVFEAMEHAGGMLRYGIPAYRLPRDVIDCQVREIEELGVEFRYSTPLKPGFGVRELKEQGYEAIFLAVGASRGRAVPIEGSDADGVIKAIDYLLNINRGYRVPLGGKVVVIGGGLVAIDAARTAVRALVPGLVMSEEEEQSVAAGTMRVALDAAREAARRGALEGYGRESRVRCRDARDEIRAGPRGTRHRARRGRHLHARMGPEANRHPRRPRSRNRTGEMRQSIRRRRPLPPAVRRKRQTQSSTPTQ